MGIVGKPESLAEQLEIETDEAISYETAVKIVSSLRPKRLHQPDWCDVEPRSVKFEHLPLKDATAGARTQVTHVVDIILDTDNVYQDRERIAGLMKSGCIAELPGVLPPKALIAMTYAMNICILPGKETGNQRDPQGEPSEGASDK